MKQLCSITEIKKYVFFTSRGRHTRWNCDWSSDVCSSDLGLSRIAKCVCEIARDMHNRKQHTNRDRNPNQKQIVGKWNRLRPKKLNIRLKKCGLQHYCLSCSFPSKILSVFIFASCSRKNRFTPGINLSHSRIS